MGNLLLPPRGLWGYVVVGEDDSTGNNDTDASSISSTENTTIAANNRTRRRGVAERIMESIDVFLGLAEPTIKTEHELLFNNITRLQKFKNKLHMICLDKI